VIKVIFLLFLISVASTACDAAQPGRITGQVHFREGPSRSARVIGVLTAGTEVQVLRGGPGDWYQVMRGERSGFVHMNYIKLAEDQRPDRRPPSMHRQLAMPAGILVTGLGIVLMASVLAPDLLIIATALVVAIMSVGGLDFLFQLGVLYSMFFVSCGAFVLFLFFKRKKKNRTASADEISQRKAA